MTLAFIGDVDSRCVGDIEAVGDGVVWPRIDLVLTHVGGWRHNRIAYAAPDETPAALAGLAESLADGLRDIGISLEKRAFHPHVTLARRCAQVRPLEAPSPIVWRVREGVLVESQRDAQGAHYHVRRRWPADAAPQ